LHRSAQGIDVPCSKGRVSCSPRSAPLATNKAPLESSRAHEYSGMGLVGPLTFMNFIDILEVVGRRRGAIPESDILGTHCGDSRQPRFVTNWYSCHELGGDGYMPALPPSDTPHVFLRPSFGRRWGGSGRRPPRGCGPHWLGPSSRRFARVYCWTFPWRSGAR